MAKEKRCRIKYQESGGGWGNPLMGQVFDSEKDLHEDEAAEFQELVDQCDLPESGELPGRPPTDAPTFQLVVEEDDKTVNLVGDMQRADGNLQSLIRFIRKHSRKEIIK